MMTGWGVKCPSGCKILGLMDKHDHDMMKKIDCIRTLLEKNQAQSSTTDRITKQTYDYLKEGLTSTSGQQLLTLLRPSPSLPSPSLMLSVF
ncbi:unnamed protein product [Arctogadus glacialis]